jgi:hypothetical protein
MRNSISQLNVVDFRSAQSLCRFAVLQPTWLPPDLSLAEVTCRPESPDYWSSLRIVIAGPGRRFRIKEFFYDWGLPIAAAHSNLRRLDRFLVTQDAVGWSGVDYKGHQAACNTSGWTQIELSVEHGSLDAEEIEAIYAGLALSCPEEAGIWTQMPFAKASYHVRKRCGPGGRDLIAGCRWGAGWNRVASEARVAPFDIPYPAGFRLDSAGYRSMPSQPSEIQLSRMAETEDGIRTDGIG